MSTELVAAEIRRFLASSEPEVLCIKGKWGVGKTFAWRKYLSDVQKAGLFKLSHYSYVSLFGLNSLDDLRYAIVEGTVTPSHAMTGPDVDTFNALLKNGFGKARPYVDTALALLGRKDGGNALAKAAFLLVRNQLICLDDLERAGEGLKLRDVLGLTSSLKEQRRCKVVLLLNDEEMAAKERAEFEKQLEKVVDVSLVFSPTPSEATAIALSSTDETSNLLRDRVNELGIVNIRVIKKIERLAKRLLEILHDCSAPIQEQAVNTVVLGAWSVLQPGEAPPLGFLRSYNILVFAMREQVEIPAEGAEAEESWMARLREYPFTSSDDLDKLIFDGIQRGYFDEAATLNAGKALDAKLAADPENNSFAKAWNLYHGSLKVEDDAVLDAMFAGAMENLMAISLVNINSTIKLFREIGRKEQANEMLSAYVEAHADNHEFFDLEEHIFMDGDKIDPDLRKAFEDHYSALTDDRDPKAVFSDVCESKSWSDRDVLLLSQLSDKDFEGLFEGLEGKSLNRSIYAALSIAHNPDSPEETKLADAVKGGLSRIAAKSPLRAKRLRRFGIEVEVNEPPLPEANVAPKARRGLKAKVAGAT